MTKRKLKPMSMSERGRLGAAAANARLSKKQLSSRMTHAINERWRKVRESQKKADRELRASDKKACKLFAETQGTTTRKVRRSMRKAKAKP